jgi:hypothetical protein
VLDRLQRQWRDQGLVPPAEAAELLAAYARELRTYGAAATVADRLDALARQQRGAATRTAATADPEGTTVNEHHEALTRAAVGHVAADLDVPQAAQAQRLSRAFPPLTVVQTHVPHLAGKQSAQIVTHPVGGPIHQPAGAAYVHADPGDSLGGRSGRGADLGVRRCWPGPEQRLRATA